MSWYGINTLYTRQARCLQSARVLLCHESAKALQNIYGVRISQNQKFGGGGGCDAFHEKSNFRTNFVRELMSCGLFQVIFARALRHL